jgi:hypothetical protein
MLMKCTVCRENMRSYARFRPLQPLSLSYLGESSSLDDIDVEREMAEIEVTFSPPSKRF